MPTRSNRLALLLVGSAIATPAFAQEPASPPGDTIVVTAARAEKTARREQALASNIVNIQSAESIAKYPDVNAAEAISRIPGVALSIDTGEGRFVNIRGLDGNLNGSTFGGVVLLNTQPGGTYFNAAGRAVEFDTMPVGSIDRIVVTKTGLPDHEAEGLGGSVELSARTAVGHDKPIIEATLGGGYEFFRRTPLLREEIVVGGGFGGTNTDGHKPFSLVLTQFLLNDKRGFDDIEAAYINAQPDTPDKAFDALELRRYQYRRQRFGYSGEFDFTPNDANRFFVRANLAGYTENVQRQRLEIDGLGNTVTVDPAKPNVFIATGVSTVKTLRDERETHRNLVLHAGGIHDFGGVKLDYFAALSRASYRKLYDYNTTFAGPAGLTVAYDNITDPNHPAFAVTNGADMLNIAYYALDSIANTTETSRDQEYSYAANLTVPVGLLADGAVKFGAKLRYRSKSSTPLNYTYRYTGASAVPLAGFVTGAPITDFYGRYAIGPDISAVGVRSFLNGMQHALHRTWHAIWRATPAARSTTPRMFRPRTRNIVAPSASSAFSPGCASNIPKPSTAARRARSLPTALSALPPPARRRAIPTSFQRSSCATRQRHISSRAPPIQPALRGPASTRRCNRRVSMSARRP